MIDGLKPYPAMKDSGVPWLGAVPEHWEMERLDRLFTLRGEQPLDGDQRVTGYLDGRVTLRSNVAGQKIKGVIKEAGWQRVYPGDFAISGMNAHLGGMGVSDSLGKCSPIYLVLKPLNDTNAVFVSHAVRRAAHSGALKAIVNTIRFNSADFKRDDLKLILVPAPTADEQSAIVRFLDHADRRIRRYIRAKQKLIKLLNEQKQAIIHRAVTRGLDPNVQLKPSGVEWLGDVPEHWDVVRLGRLIRLTTGFAFKSDGFSQSESDVRLLRGINIAPGRLRWDVVVRWPTTDSDAFADFEMKPGDIVLGMDRPIIGGGVRVAELTEDDVPSLLLQRVARIRPLDELNIKFTLLLLSGKSFSDYLAPIFTGISVPHVSPEQIGAFRLALPSTSEQTLIVKWATDATASIDTAIGAAQREIDLLREYRTRLIADVVTGKLDVRQAAANLPDEAAAPEAIDEADLLAEGDEISDEEELVAASEEADA